MTFFKFKYKMHQMMYGDTRKKNTKNILVSALAIISSIVLSLVIAMIIYRDGSLFYEIARLIFIIPFSTNYISHTVSTIAIFGVGALAFLIAFRSGLFNIGISGQMIFGAIAAVVFGQYMINLPSGLGQILMLLISICFAGLLAGIIGALKAFFNMNEVVSSIVFN
jgi:simple sugar transport system permease protein